MSENEAWDFEYPLPRDITIGRIKCGVEPKEPKKPTPLYGPVADVVGKWAVRDFESSSDPDDKWFSREPCFILDVLPEKKKILIIYLDGIVILHDEYSVALGPPYFDDKWREVTPQELDILLKRYLHATPEHIKKKVREMKEEYCRTGHYDDCWSTSSGEGESESPECSDDDENNRIFSMNMDGYTPSLRTCKEFARQETRQLNPKQTGE